MSFNRKDNMTEHREEFIGNESNVDAMLAVRFGFWGLICIRASQRFGIPENFGA
jgi:hypothetical protein